MLWINDNLNNTLNEGISEADIQDASDRLLRFASYIKRVFPETVQNDGIIETPIVEIPNMKKLLEKECNEVLNGTFMLKCANLLPISGSIKSRGGIMSALVCRKSCT